MPIVDLSKLKPVAATVMIGELEIEMRTASIERCENLFEVVADLQLEKLAAPIIALIAQLRQGGGDVFALLKENAESVIAAARPVLGKQLAPALKAAVIAMLDTAATRRALTRPFPATEGMSDAEKLRNTPLGVAANDERDIVRDDDGVYLGSHLVRAYLREETTLVQAVHVVVEALRISDFRAAMGNLWTGLTATVPASEEKETPKDGNKASGAKKAAKAS